MIFEHKIKENKIAFLNKVKKIAQELSTDPNWLMAVMNFESAGTFSPKIQNPISNATGLIQFMPSTAKWLGTTVDELKAMSNVQQLDYVYKYLRPYKTKMKSFVDVYLTVFYPAAVGKPKTYIIGNTAARQHTIANQNKGFDIDKSKQITIAEIEQILYQRMPELKQVVVKKKNNIIWYFLIPAIASTSSLFILKKIKEKK